MNEAPETAATASAAEDRRTTPKGVGNYAEAVIPPNLFRGPAPTEI